MRQSCPFAMGRHGDNAINRGRLRLQAPYIHGIYTNGFKTEPVVSMRRFRLLGGSNAKI